MKLNNTYYILRHGQSEANVLDIITSDPTQCISHYGLTQHGKEQVAASILLAKSRGWLGADTLIYCSDFKRTVETATIARQLLNAGELHLSIALRERFFGEYDGKHTEAYVQIWPKDEDDRQMQQRYGVEDAEKMRSRLLGFMKFVEAQYRDRCLLLVSHGDPLQVLQAAYGDLDLDQSRSLSYIEPGEIRGLRLLAAVTE